MNPPAPHAIAQHPGERKLKHVRQTRQFAWTSTSRSSYRGGRSMRMRCTSRARRLHRDVGARSTVRRRHRCRASTASTAESSSSHVWTRRQRRDASYSIAHRRQLNDNVSKSTPPPSLAGANAPAHPLPVSVPLPNAISSHFRLQRRSPSRPVYPVYAPYPRISHRELDTKCVKSRRRLRDEPDPHTTSTPTSAPDQTNANGTTHPSARFPESISRPRYRDTAKLGARSRESQPGTPNDADYVPPPTQPFKPVHARMKLERLYKNNAFTAAELELRKNLKKEFSGHEREDGEDADFEALERNESAPEFLKRIRKEYSAVLRYPYRYESNELQVFVATGRYFDSRARFRLAVEGLAMTMEEDDKVASAALPHSTTYTSSLDAARLAFGRHRRDLRLTATSGRVLHDDRPSSSFRRCLHAAAEPGGQAGSEPGPLLVSSTSRPTSDDADDGATCASSPFVSVAPKVIRVSRTVSSSPCHHVYALPPKGTPPSLIQPQLLPSAKPAVHLAACPRLRHRLLRAKPRRVCAVPVAAVLRRHERAARSRQDTVSFLHPSSGAASFTYNTRGFSASNHPPYLPLAVTFVVVVDVSRRCWGMRLPSPSHGHFLPVCLLRIRYDGSKGQADGFVAVRLDPSGADGDEDAMMNLAQRQQSAATSSKT
uniref:Uncharacterized protein n=1 Tax=Mycena chlorophos TaxID=658473 RepID=A0ABQ0LM12_MYCCL|nr:predicted protein [Mycena chlorophos]